MTKAQTAEKTAADAAAAAKARFNGDDWKVTRDDATSAKAEAEKELAALKPAAKK